MPSPTASCVEGKGMAAAPPFMLCLISIKRMFKDLRPQRSDLKLGLSLPLPAHCPNSSSPSAKTRPASKTGEAGVVIVVLEFWKGSVRFDSFPLPRSMPSQLATSVRSKQCLQPAATCTSKKGSSLHVKTSLQVTSWNVDLLANLMFLVELSALSLHHSSSNLVCHKNTSHQ